MILSTKQIAATMIMGAIMACAGTGQAAPGNAPGPRYQMQPYNQQWLTPEQQQQARQIYNETLAATNNARQALNMKRAELDQELANPNPDSARIEALSREIGELRGKLLGARAQARAKLAQQGLPPDGFGSNNYYGGNGWDGYYHHGRGHGRGHGRPWGCGYWNGMGMGMMGGY